jgi:hypothetical protein
LPTTSAGGFYSRAGRLLKLLQQRCRGPEIAGVESFGEPGLHRRQQVAGGAGAALRQPEPGEAHRGAQFP